MSFNYKQVFFFFSEISLFMLCLRMERVHYRFSFAIGKFPVSFHVHVGNLRKHNYFSGNLLIYCNISSNRMFYRILAAKFYYATSRAEG